MITPPTAQRVGQLMGSVVVALFGGVVIFGLVVTLGVLIGVVIRVARWAAGPC